MNIRCASDSGRTRNSGFLSCRAAGACGILPTARGLFRSLVIVVGLCAVRLFFPPAICAGINRWTSAGPTGGTVWHIAQDPTNPSVLYNATEGGPFKSTDGGETWKRIDGIFKVSGFDMGQRSFWMTVAPDLPTMVYAGTDRTLFRSEDGGITWKYKSQGLPPSADVLSVVCDPLNPATVYAAVYWVGVYKSTDRGETWTPAGSGLPASDPEVFALAVNPRTPSTVFAALAEAGIYKTVNGGETWTKQSTGLAGRCYALAMDQSNPEVLYAGTEGGLFKSVDGGNTWTATGTGLPAETPPSAIAIAPDNPSTLWAAIENHGAWRSDDGGATWRAKNTGLVTSLTAEVFWIHPQAGGVALAATRAGIYKTSDGGNRWTRKNKGLVASGVYAVEIAADGAWYAATYGNGISKSTNRGASWTAVNTGLSRSGGSLWFSALAADPSAPSTVYAAGHSGFFKTSDGGGTWAALPLAETGQALLIDPLDHLTLYAGTNTGVFKSTDGGTSWQPARNGLSLPTFSLAFRPGQPSVVFAGTSSGIFRSTDGGASWTFKGVPGENIWDLASDPRQPLLVYGVSDYAPYESADGGETWQSLEQLQEPMSLWTAAVNPSNSNFFAAGGDGVWEFNRPYRSWRLDNHGSLTARYVLSLKLDPGNPSNRIAGIYGGGVATWEGRGIQWPNGRESVPSGRNYLIQWVRTPGAHHYAVEYSLDGGGLWLPIAAGITKDYHLWKAPVPRGNRRRCLVRLISYNANGEAMASDRSDAPFTVEVARMDSPWAEETVRPGTFYDVHWRVNGTEKPVAGTILYFRASSGATWKRIAALPGESRSYRFLVPNIDSDTSQFQVVLLDALGQVLGSDKSDLYLKIKP